MPAAIDSPPAKLSSGQTYQPHFTKGHYFRGSFLIIEP